jgi:hypothetical protein
LLHKPIKVSKWMPDDAAEGCRRCKRAFGLFRRRHHCRYCGDLVCADESRAKVVLATGAAPVRACDRCLRRIIGRIDALFDRRYMRAAILSQSPPNDGRGQPLSPLSALPATDEGEGFGAAAEEESGGARGGGARGAPDCGAASARSFTGLHLRARAAGALHNGTHGGEGHGSSRDLAADGDPLAGTSIKRWALQRTASTASSSGVAVVGGESSRSERFFKALVASLLAPFGVAAGDASAADETASFAADLPSENGDSGDSGGSGGDKDGDKDGGDDDDDDGLAAGIVARVSCALLVRPGDGSGQGDDDNDVESTDGGGDDEDGGLGANCESGGGGAVRRALGAALAAGGGAQGCRRGAKHAVNGEDAGDSSGTPSARGRSPSPPWSLRRSRSLGDAPAGQGGIPGAQGREGRAGSAGGDGRQGGAAAEPADLAFAPVLVLADHSDGGAEVAAAKEPQGGSLGAMLAAAGVVKKGGV